MVSTNCIRMEKSLTYRIFIKSAVVQKILKFGLVIIWTTSANVEKKKKKNIYIYSYRIITNASISVLILSFTSDTTESNHIHYIIIIIIIYYSITMSIIINLYIPHPWDLVPILHSSCMWMHLVQ